MDLLDHAPDALLRRPHAQARLASFRRLHPPERVTQEIELPFRYLADSCLLLVDRELQASHELAHSLQGLSGLASFLVCVLSPLPRRSGWRYCFAQPPSRVSLPRYGSRVGLRIVLFEACSAFTRVTACTLALSPYFVTRFTRRLQTFRLLHACSGCFRLERLPGGIRTHWKAPPYHGARQKQTFRPTHLARFEPFDHIIGTGID
jgi:hypothetical protein